MHLTIFSIAGFIPLKFRATVPIFYIAPICYWNLRSAIGKRASSTLARRRIKSAQRAQLYGDVTTELATAPGESSSYPQRVGCGLFVSFDVARGYGM